MRTAKMIKKYRKKMGVTQSYLSKRLGFAEPQFVSNWEREMAIIPKAHLLDVSSLLDIPEEDFIKAFKKDKGDWAWERG